MSRKPLAVLLAALVGTITHGECRMITKRRSRALSVVVASVLALSGCVTQETIERQRKIEEIKEDARARQEAAAAEDEEAPAPLTEQEIEWKKWYDSPSTQAYVCELCSMPPGPMRDEARAIAARDYDLHMLACRPECTLPTTESAPAPQD